MATEPTPIGYDRYDEIVSDWNGAAIVAMHTVKSNTRCTVVRVTEISLMAFNAKGDEVVDRAYYCVPDGDTTSPDFSTTIGGDDLNEYVKAAIEAGATEVYSDARADAYWSNPSDSVFDRYDMMDGVNGDWYTPGPYLDCNPVWTAA